MPRPAAAAPGYPADGTGAVSHLAREVAGGFMAVLIGTRRGSSVPHTGWAKRTARLLRAWRPGGR